MSALKRKKHELFAQEYLKDLNQTQAAIRAGYSPKSANQTASEIMAIPNVRARVDELMAERAVRTGVNQDRVIRELARIAFASAPDFIDPKDASLRADASEDDKAAIASIRVKRKECDDFIEVEREIKMADKIKALELLGKHMAMFQDRIVITDEIPRIVDDVGTGVTGDG